MDPRLIVLLYAALVANLMTAPAQSIAFPKGFLTGPYSVVAGHPF